MKIGIRRSLFYVNNFYIVYLEQLKNTSLKKVVNRFIIS